MQPQTSEDAPEGDWDDAPVDDEAEALADAEARADLDAGRFVSWEAVKRWMLSWGTPQQLPPPQIGD